MLYTAEPLVNQTMHLGELLVSTLQFPDAAQALIKLGQNQLRFDLFLSVFLSFDFMASSISFWFS